MCFFFYVCVRGSVFVLQCWLKSPLKALAQYWHNRAPYTLNLCLFARKTTTLVAANEAAAFKSTFCLFCLLLCTVISATTAVGVISCRYINSAFSPYPTVQIVVLVKLSSTNLQTLDGLCRALVKSYTDANICRQIRPNIHKPGLVHKCIGGNMAVVVSLWLKFKTALRGKHIKPSVHGNLVLFWTAATTADKNVHIYSHWCM